MENKALLDEKFWGENTESEKHPLTEAEMAIEIRSNSVFESVGTALVVLPSLSLA